MFQISEQTYGFVLVSDPDVLKYILDSITIADMG